MISTAVMMKLGYTYRGLMVNVQPTNRKLEDRACRIIAQITKVSMDRAAELLDLAARSVPTAIVMEKKHVSRSEAESLLSQARGHLAIALGEQALGEQALGEPTGEEPAPQEPALGQ
jgi:N-acetylmuramic acid 6-phosphate etherase